MTGIGAKLLSDFGTRKGAGAFSYAPDRALYAKDVRARAADPSLIRQRKTSLCGPASFLFCLASKSPDVYIKFALDLFEHGKAVIGYLVVSPSSDCKKAVLSTADSMSPVDWVTLAALRDSSNMFRDYQSPSDEIAGITLPSTMVNWFQKCGEFHSIVDNTSLFYYESLSNLLSADSARSAGSYICMLVGANVLSGIPRANGYPDHWVVLDSQVRIDGNTTTALASQGTKVDDDKKLQKSNVAFNVATWGAHYPINGSAKPLPVSSLLQYYYGYVCAK